MRQYRAKNGATQWMPSVNEAIQMDDEGDGFCLACGETQAAEPDARKQTCESCDADKVYGAAELVLMGLVYSEERRGHAR